MKQLDIVVSPPTFVWDPNLTLTHVTVDLDPRDLWPYLGLKRSLRYELLFSNFGVVTERETDRQKTMHMSRPCISTGGLKKGP